MNKKERMYAQIEQHGANLNAIFNTQYDNITLCKKLHRLEVKAHNATTALCNTNTLNWMQHPQPWTLKQTSEEEQDKFFDKIRASLVKILGKEAEKALIINFDPRGYALKIGPAYINERGLKIYQDWGGNGILAPEFDGEE